MISMGSSRLGRMSRVPERPPRSTPIRQHYSKVFVGLETPSTKTVSRVVHNGTYGSFVSGNVPSVSQVLYGGRNLYCFKSRQ